MSNKNTCCYNLVNEDNTPNGPQEDRVRQWFFTCNCKSSHSCNCEAKMKLNILLVLDHPHESLPPTQSQPHLIIEFIEFTYYDDRFSLDVTTKETKYDISIKNIICQGWQVEPLITLSWC